jgi:hypothetical protein
MKRAANINHFYQGFNCKAALVLLWYPGFPMNRLKPIPNAAGWLFP